jgi:ubiquinone/menaquinone biosynthesis C-methylase UbiE
VSDAQAGRKGGFAAAAVAEAYRRHLLGPVFEPWAHHLIDQAGLRSGQRVLDVASGLGPVARRAAAVVGRRGMVVASDVSASMLALAAGFPLEAGWAPVACCRSSALALAAPDASFDAVVCQQGLQFFGDRRAALAEMLRVCRAGGGLTLSCWAAEAPLGLFGPMAEAVSTAGVAEPYPHAFDPAAYQLGAEALADLAGEAGWRAVTVERSSLVAGWPDGPDVGGLVAGTPYARHVAALAPGARAEVTARLAAALGARPGQPLRIQTTSNLLRARAG